MIYNVMVLLILMNIGRADYGKKQQMAVKTAHFQHKENTVGSGGGYNTAAGCQVDIA